MFSKSELESLEMLSDKVLDNMDCKPNYNNMAFLNIIVLFQSAMMDKMWDLMEEERMEQDDREKMSEKAGQELHKLIHTFTGINIQGEEKVIIEICVQNV